MVLANPGRVFADTLMVAVGSSSGAQGAPRAFHRRLPSYEVTPLIEAPELAAAIGVARLVVKVESSRLGLPAFKMLGASWAIYRTLVERLDREPQWSTLAELRSSLAELGPLTLVSATDGNHGRAVARMASLLGYRARIFVPAGTAEARIRSIESEGAVCAVVDGTYDEAVAVSAKEAADDVLIISDTSWEGYDEVPGWVIDGYSTIFDEVDEQLDGVVPDIVVSQMGVGALTAAVCDHYARTSTVVVVEPLTAACGLRSAGAGHLVEVAGPHGSIMAGLNCGNVSGLAWPRVSAGVDAFVAIPDDAAEGAMRDLSAIGIEAGESGAAGLAGLAAWAAGGAEGLRDPGERGGLGALAASTAMVICTEGATDPAAYQRVVGRPPGLT